MLNEEEKNAIEYIKEFRNEVFEGVGNKSIMAKNIDILLNILDKQQKEIEREEQYTDFYKDLCNKQQKEIKKEKNRIMELAELLDKQENEINSLQQELEIQKGCSISKDKIRKIINKYVDIDEHLNYTNQELYGEDLKNMINELLEEK